MLEPDFVDPPAEFSLCPFWFWNDELSEAEIVRQIDDFLEHGVKAFVIHPRVGLPRHLGWMSDALLHFVRLAVDQAAARGMWVVLYDEGMYPSGSSCGQVVAENPAFACRGLVRQPAGTLLGEDEVLIAKNAAIQVIERRIESVIRGLHYVGDGPEEDTPQAADILNSEAVACFIRKVYDRYAEAVGDHFGTTVKGIFTDEPSLLGRPQQPDVLPAMRGFFASALGEDLREQVFELWNPDHPARHEYDRRLRHALDKTYYAPLSAWCREHGIALMGHPEPPDELEVLRHFDVPGQDLVWRWVLPGVTAICGPQSTQAKTAASAAHWQDRRRNSNEFAGAYGHELTETEFRWLFDWCILRGTNLFFPHAFYYSVRGVRKDERPPDVGPNSAWWKGFATFAKRAARLAWLNADSEAVIHYAIQTVHGRAPWEAAKACFERQIDFLYVAPGQSHDLLPLPDDLDDAVRTLNVESHPDLRARRIRKAGHEIVIVQNEGPSSLDLALNEPFIRLDPETLGTEQTQGRLRLAPFELTLLIVP